MCGRGVQAWRYGRSWRVGPKEILIILIIDVPSIVSAAGKLMEATGLFRFRIVKFGLCVLVIPEKGQILTLN